MKMTRQYGLLYMCNFKKEHVYAHFQSYVQSKQLKITYAHQ